MKSGRLVFLSRSENAKGVVRRLWRRPSWNVEESPSSACFSNATPKQFNRANPRSIILTPEELQRQRKKRRPRLRYLGRCWLCSGAKTVHTVWGSPENVARATIRNIVLMNDSAGKSEATRTGLEPATSGSTVRDSNQLSYRAFVRRLRKSFCRVTGTFRVEEKYICAEQACNRCQQWEANLCLPSVELRPIMQNSLVFWTKIRFFCDSRNRFSVASGPFFVGELGFFGRSPPFSAGCFSPYRRIEFTMDYLLLAFSVSDWFADSWYELQYYGAHLTKTHWAVISATSVIFGFLCLKGNSFKI